MSGEALGREHYVDDNAIGYLEDIIFATESEN